MLEDSEPIKVTDRKISLNQIEMFLQPCNIHMKIYLETSQSNKLGQFIWRLQQD